MRQARGRREEGKQDDTMPIRQREEETVRDIHKELVDMKTKVSYDAMAVLFRRYELAKPSTQLLYDKRWLTTFVSEPVTMFKVVATTPGGKLLSIFGAFQLDPLNSHDVNNDTHTHSRRTSLSRERGWLTFCIWA